MEYYCSVVAVPRSGTVRAARTVALAALVLLLSHAETLFAQELVPRAYWPSPVGTNVLVLGYQYSSGDIVVDQSLPVVGVDSTIDCLSSLDSETAAFYTPLDPYYQFHVWGKYGQDYSGVNLT